MTNRTPAPIGPNFSSIAEAVVTSCMAATATIGYLAKATATRSSAKTAMTEQSISTSAQLLGQRSHAIELSRAGGGSSKVSAVDKCLSTTEFRCHVRRRRE